MWVRSFLGDWMWTMCSFLLCFAVLVVATAAQPLELHSTLATSHFTIRDDEVVEGEIVVKSVRELLPLPVVFAAHRASLRFAIFILFCFPSQGDYSCTFAFASKVSADSVRVAFL